MNTEATPTRDTTTETALPKTADEVTVEWLDHILAESGVLVDGRIESFEIHPIPPGFGLACSYARIRLHCGLPQPEAPEWVFVKFSKDTLASRSLCENEVRFYREIAPSIRLPIPRCYFAGRDESDGACVVVLEDLSTGTAGDSLAGCSADAAETMLREIGAFHARWWENPRLSQWDWIQPSNAPGGIIDRMRRCWPDFRKSHSDVLTPAVTEAGDHAVQRLERIFEALIQEPTTLIHGDFKLDNMRLDVADARFALLDWQLVTRGKSARDLTWFLARSLPIEQRRSEEDHLIDIYYRSLIDNGVQNYSVENLKFHMNLMFLFDLLIDAVTSTGETRASERGRRRLRASIERDVAAIEDHTSWEVLE